MTAIARVIEGNIEGIDDLNRAEMALQALLLSNSPQVYVPAIRIFGSGVRTGYYRADYDLRSQLAFELFDLETSWDYLVASEAVQVEDGIIMGSTDQKSKHTGKRLADLSYSDLNLGRSPESAPLVLSDMLKVPSYYSEASTERARRGDGFQKRFYSQLNVSWKRATANIPPVVCSFSIPPLLAIVLDQANSRQDIPAIITGLRSELTEVRKELIELNSIATSAAGQAEIEALVKRVEQSFSAILPESRLTQPEKLARRFFRAQSVIRPIVQLATGFFLNNGNSIADIPGIAQQAAETFVQTEKIVERTITASKFAPMVKTESIQQLVKHHFSEVEILAIEQSLDAN